MDENYLIYRKARGCTAEHFVTRPGDTATTAQEAAEKVMGENPDSFSDGDLILVVLPDGETHVPTVWVFGVAVQAARLLTEYEV